MEFNEIIIKNFELYFDGSYNIVYTRNGKEKLLRVALDFAMIFKMLKIEGVSPEQVEPWYEYSEPLSFEKVSLVIFEADNKKDSYRIASCSDRNPQDIFDVEVR